MLPSYVGPLGMQLFTEVWLCVKEKEDKALAKYHLDKITVTLNFEPSNCNGFLSAFTFVIEFNDNKWPIIVKLG